MGEVLAVRSAVTDLCGKSGDETIRDYIMAVLELGDYEFGRNGEMAYDHFGQMLVDVSPKKWLFFVSKIGIPLHTCKTMDMPLPIAVQ